MSTLESSLEQLPLELQSIIINLLDFKSCIEFCKTSHFYNNLVRELLQNLIIPPVWYYDLIYLMRVGGRLKYALSSSLKHIQPWYSNRLISRDIWSPASPSINPDIVAKFPNIKNIIDYSECELDSPMIVISKQERLKLMTDNKAITNQDFATKIRNEYYNSVYRYLFLSHLESVKIGQNTLYGFCGGSPLFMKKRYTAVLYDDCSQVSINNNFHKIQKENNKTRKLLNKKQRQSCKFVNKGQYKYQNKCNKRIGK